jgi:dihydroorotate dehydrogenase (fumarate)
MPSFTTGAIGIAPTSLFEEQIEHEELAVHWALDVGQSSSAESLDYFPELDDYNTGLGRCVEHFAATKHSLDVPVMASLNGSSPGGWVRYARLIEEA